MLLSIVLLLIGLAILIGGAEYLVRGASSTAKHFGISSLVIGLTVVAFGTSAPELVVNLISAFKGSTDLAIGNIVGSNLANILLILGVGAAIKTLEVKSGTTYKEIPFALLAIFLVAVMGNDHFFDGVGFNALSRIDGMILLAFFVIFMYYTFGISKISGRPEKIATYPWSKTLGMILLGLGGLALGGHLIVTSATELAIIAGLSQAMIGLTIVGVGTSLPELATTVVAVRKGHTDLAIGNAVGSNIFNVFLVLGLTATVHPLAFDININTDVIFTVFATVLLFVFMFIHSKQRINRWQGVMFLIIYFSYISYVIFR